MASCFEPGRIIILPKADGPEPDSKPVETLFNVLRRADAKTPKQTKDWLVPALHAVKTGHEIEECRRLIASARVTAACPNFYVRPETISVSLAEQTLTSMLHSTCISGAPPLGEGVRIAVLDSGW